MNYLKSLLIVVICYTNTMIAQNTTPKVASNVLNTIYNTTCDCLNKTDDTKLTTPELITNSINNCLIKAINKNEEIIKQDRSAQPQNGYNSGKEYGRALGKEVSERLKNNCQALAKLKK